MRINKFLKLTLLSTILLLHGCHYKSAKKPAETSTESVINIVTKPATSKPIEAKPIEPKPIEPKPIEPKPIEPKPIEPKPIEPKPIEPKPIESKPIEPEPIKLHPIESDKANTLFRIKGHIFLDQSRLKEKNAELENTIVYFEPANKPNTKLPKTDAVISTLNKQFKPSVLAITAGSTVSFPNMDRILHNVFSVSPLSEFDLGLYSAGMTKDVIFEKPGVIYVHCNVHHSMQADILVLDTPYFTQVEADGSFELPNIPQLTGTFNAWHPRGNIKSLNLTQYSDYKNIQQSLEITRPEVPKHSNKFGKSYRRVRY